MQVQQLRLLGKEALTGIADPGNEFLEADLLICHATGLTRPRLLANPDASIEGDGVKRALEFIERRKTHEPIAYIVGHKEFFGFDFEITPDVLVPRPETELLVELVLGRAIPLCEEARPFTVIDIGTGSGAIVLALARTLGERFGEPMLQGLKFVGVDRSAEALQLAARNAESLELLPYVLFGPSDLLSVFAGKLDKFERPIFFVANLPYIPDGELLPPSVEEFEPTIALRGGPDGLAIVRRCIEQWKSVAKVGEPLFLEVGQGQAAKLISLSPEGLSAKVHKDLSGIERVVELEKLEDIGTA